LVCYLQVVVRQLISHILIPCNWGFFQKILVIELWLWYVSLFCLFMFLLVFSCTKLMFGRFINLASVQALPFYHFKELVFNTLRTHWCVRVWVQYWLKVVYNKGCVTLWPCHLHIKRYLKAKEELWKLKYFTMQKCNLQKILWKKTKILQDIITP
jgi:hypothetical protein